MPFDQHGVNLILEIIIRSRYSLDPWCIDNAFGRVIPVVLFSYLFLSEETRFAPQEFLLTLASDISELWPFNYSWLFLTLPGTLMNSEL